MGGSFSVISGTIRNVVHLIQQKRQVEILASPSVMMVSGESASIEAVEELPYTEVIDTAAGGAAALTSTEFKRVGIQLTVNATLTDDNDIFLTVDAEQNVATGESEREVPIVDTRKANTSLLLKDGQVVIFGGLRRQEKTEKVNQIPIIGDLPIVGNLFKSTSNVVKNSELIVFLSPHIYKGEPVPGDAMSKYKQIRDRPILSLPMDAKLKGYRNQLELRVNEHTTAIEQLQQEITEYERTEGELKEYRERLEKRVNEQTGANEQLQDDIAECKQAVDELREYRYQLEQRIMEQSTTNKQLQTQVSEGKRTEGELEEYRDQLEQRVKEQTVAIEQLQLEITKRKQAERDITKKMLLDRIKILRNRKNKDATKELLSTLTSLDEILSQEMQETISSSERILADEGYRVDGNP